MFCEHKNPPDDGLKESWSQFGKHLWVCFCRLATKVKSISTRLAGTKVPETAILMPQAATIP